MRTDTKELALAVATLGGVGQLRPAPGTWGSLAAIPIAYVVHDMGGFIALLVATGVLFFVGLLSTAVATRGEDDHDPSEIVIDEVVGQMIAIFPLSYPAWAQGLDILDLWPGWVAAFALFRLFDILKPGPVGWADRRGNALGVMLDDVIAGILAAIGVMILAGLWHGVLGL